MSSGKTIRLIDIAQRMGLTVNTVSRALRDKSDIGVDTKEKVKRIASEMGYIPNTIASSLRKGSSKTIAIVFDNLMNPYFMIMADKIHKILDNLGYASMIFAGNNGEFTDDMLSPIVSRKVDGIITFLEPKPSVITSLRQNQIPIVLVGRKNTTLEMDSVATEDFAGGYAIGKLFIESGAKKIGYIGAPETVECSKRRLSGLDTCLHDFQVKVDPKWYRYMSTPNIDDDFSYLIGCGVDAIFCFNDMMAMEVVTLAKARNINIPEQLRIAGFDDIQSEFMIPIRLTTITSDKNSIIAKAIQLLLDKIKHAEAAFGHRYIDFEVFLKLGDTT